MNKTDANKLQYFSWEEIRECSIEASRISWSLMHKLDLLRTELKMPIYLLHLDTGKHVPNSYHYLGLAADIKFKGKQPPANKVLQKAIDVGFRGIGIYNSFYHVDVRQNTALWKRVKGEYLPLI